MSPAKCASTNISGPRHESDLLYIKTDVHTGRTYHATDDIPVGSTVLRASTPYTYTIWKQFRNEVCAECWRYEGGRRTFLKQRDDIGVTNSAGGANRMIRNGTRVETIGAGLWFCDEGCQGAWIAREGMETITLFRVLEEARRKKEEGKKKPNPMEAAQITADIVDQAWTMVRDKERNLKERKKWRNLQLDNFETDMARYVLLALIHLRRELQEAWMPSQNQQTQATDACICHDLPTDGRHDLQFWGATWDDFTTLQHNELNHLRTYPKLLEDQIRIYKVLKGRFAESNSSMSDHKPVGPADEGVHREEEQNHGARPGHHQGDGIGKTADNGDMLMDLGSAITIDNVRAIFSVDPGNSFGIWEVPLTEESECLGFAVYPRLSFFNHHCSPNVNKERYGRGLAFVTTRSVRAGEELCISYGHAEGMGWRQRQKELREGWFFECSCGKCIVDMSTVDEGT